MFTKIYNFYFITVVTLTLLNASACLREESSGSAEIIKNIQLVMTAQVQAWNNGNIEEYMAGYYHSDSLRFASGGTVLYGWESTLDRYKKGYPDKSTMGVLTFSDVDITIISENAALVFGKWQLERENKTNTSGLFTLIFRRTNLGWRIIHDHTSSRTN